MDELTMLENDVLSLFFDLSDELNKETQTKITEGIIRDLFEFLRSLKANKA